MLLLEEPDGFGERVMKLDRTTCRELCHQPAPKGDVRCKAMTAGGTGLRAKITEEHPKTELTKPPKPSSVSFVSHAPGLVPIISADHEAWAVDYRLWIRERCAQRETHEDWGAVGSLLCDFAEWSVNRGEVPCSRQTFERLLQDAEFVIVNGMARGLVLKVDLHAVLANVEQPHAKRRRL